MHNIFRGDLGSFCRIASFSLPKCSSPSGRDRRRLSSKDFHLFLEPRHFIKQVDSLLLGVSTDLFPVNEGIEIHTDCQAGGAFLEDGTAEVLQMFLTGSVGVDGRKLCYNLQ